MPFPPHQDDPTLCLMYQASQFLAALVVSSFLFQLLFYVCIVCFMNSALQLINKLALTYRELKVDAVKAKG